jgi:hypothetical protein
MVIEEDDTGGDDRVRDLKAENARKSAARGVSLKEAEAAQEVRSALLSSILLYYVFFPCVVLCRSAALYL